MRHSMTEEQLAEVVCKYLEDLKFEVYKEVQCSYGGPIYDIVAKRGALIWVVECKTQFNATVCAQASRALHDANFVSIAVPNLPYNRKASYVVKSWLRQVIRQQGIGVIEVQRWEIGGEIEDDIREDSRPKFRRSRSQMLDKTLHERHKDYAPAGNAEGLRWSPFKGTCERLASYVGKHPGCSMKEAIEKIDHHYKTPTSARQSLAKWIKGGKVPGLKIENSRLYSTDASAGGSPETVHSRRDREPEV